MNRALLIVSILLISVKSVIAQNESEYQQLIKKAGDAYKI